MTKTYREVDYPAELAKKFGIGTEDFIRTNRQNTAMARLCLGKLCEKEVSEIIVSQNPGAKHIDSADFVTENYAPDSKILERLATIRSRGLVKLALVSNIFPASIQYLHEHGVLEYFDRTFFSCEIGDKKPNASYFSTVLNDCDVEPEATLFLDDTSENVAAAQRLNIPSRLITESRQVYEILDGFANG